MIRRWCKFGSALVAAALFWSQGPCAFAWGPHSQITQAALDALGSKDPLLRHLGSQAELLPNYCWLSDWPHGFIVLHEREMFYADDFLLFPAKPQHVPHECPGVRRSFRPHFQRAVQALRTETPANAARWIGALLHFTEDTGSPPHALGILGDVHTKMENWVDAKQIKLDGYQPRSLGDTEEKALDGYLKRMEGLIAYSKERGERLKPLVENGERAKVEPLVWECALETSRVTADLLFTLGQIALAPVKDTAILRGTVSTKPTLGLEKLLAKVVLEGTNYSTLTDAAGVYEFHQLPPNTYRVTVLVPGDATAAETVKLTAGETRKHDLTVPKTDPPGNLVRNADFRAHWVEAKLPDGWYRKQTADKKTEWEGEILPVQAGKRYQLSVRWKKGVTGEVVLLWQMGKPLDHTCGFEGLHYYSATTKKVDTPLAAPDTAQTFVAPPQARSVLIIFRTAGAPDTVCEHVALTAERSADDREQNRTFKIFGAAAES